MSSENKRLPVPATSFRDLAAITFILMEKVEFLVSPSRAMMRGSFFPNFAKATPYAKRGATWTHKKTRGQLGENVAQ